MRRLLFLPRSWQSGFLILLTLFLTLGHVRGLQWQDEDSVIIEAASDDKESSSNSITATARQKRQFGAGFPFGPHGFPQLPGFPSGFPGFPGGFPGGFPSLFPTVQPIQHTTQKPAVVHPGQTDSCLTRSGDPGYCATLRQCYPVVYSTVEGEDTNDGDEYLRNRGLAEILREKSGPCHTYTFYNIFMFRADAEARQRLICCPNPTKPPPQTIDNPNQTMRPPWAIPTTTTTTTTEQPKQSTYVPWTQWTQWTQKTTNAPWTQSTTSAPWTQWTQSTTNAPSTHVPWQHPTHPPLPTHPPDHTAATHPPFPQHPQQHPPTAQPPPQWPPPQQTTQSPTHPPQQYPIPQDQQPPHHPPPSQTPQPHPPPVASSCGHTKVVGGVQAQKGEFPWLVSLFTNSKQFCGGSLIDSQYVLTAAHCVAHMTSQDVQRMRVHVGDYDIYSNSDGPVTVRSVSKLIRHRGFSHQTLHNDIALLKLDSPVPLGSNGNNNIQPVCLNTQGGYDSGSHKATVAGWGSVYENGPQPSIYRKVEMRIWTNQECARKYGSYAPGGITSHMVCAGSGTSDACRGDSGGPLAHNSGGRWVQIGIVSWGIGCGRYPGVYSRVDQFSPWITKNRAY